MRKLFLLLALVLPATARAQENLGFKVPEGFEVTLYAGDDLATDIHCLTIDARGRVVVAGKGYIKILHDTKGTGKADKATLFADMPKSGAHGMYFDGDDLIVVGDQGVRRLYDRTGQGSCDEISEPFFKTVKDTEHGTNALVKGPDGWFYVIAGNDAGFNKSHVNTKNSPIREPNAGVLVRFSPDGKAFQVVAEGFRNPYGLAINHLGHAFTVDADGERIYHMPYYTPTRLFDIASGRHHGWLTPGWMKAWARPQWFPDNVDRLNEIGRGSPTGVVVYRHHAFPERYRNGVFSQCWTLGRIYFFPLERKDSGYATKMEIFLQSTGDQGFAPTAMAVGPEGDLFVSIGGRGTKGSVYRVRYTGKMPPHPVEEDSLKKVLFADEPLASWSREKWVPLAKELGAVAFEEAALTRTLPAEARIRAIEVVTELYGGISVLAAKRLVKDQNPEVAARAVWAVKRLTEDGAAFLMEATAATDARVARAAWEALAHLGDFPEPEPTIDWKTGIHHADRRVRAACLAAARGYQKASFLAHFHMATQPDSRLRLAGLWAYQGTQASTLNWPRYCFKEALPILEKETDVEMRLEAVRLLQLALGDVNIAETGAKILIGYGAQDPEKVGPEIRKDAAQRFAKLLPSKDANLDCELARLLGMLETDVPGLPEKIAGRWLDSNTTGDDIHYLLCLARLPGARTPEVSTKTAAALNGIFVKLGKQGDKPSDMMPAILEKLFERLVELDPKLPVALVADAAFGHPDHALFANLLPGTAQPAAARKLLAGIAKLDETEARVAWNADLVKLVARMPEQEGMPILRHQFKDPRLTDSIALVLARKKDKADRERLIQALSSTQPPVIQACAETLMEWKGEKATAAELTQALRVLRRLGKTPGEKAARESTNQLLETWTGHRPSAEDLYPAWLAWFKEHHPKEAEAFTSLGGTDPAAWKKRLDKIDWETGDLKKGELVFQRKNCFRCHGDARRLGPDLAGIAQRFNRDDLFTAILDPSKDISPAYVAKTVLTRSGKVYNGIEIYTSPEGVLLQVTPDTTVRIPREELQLIQPSAVSFMPNGLLDDLKDEELADLYAFMKGLRKK